jgi:Uma2 family endonuclease
MVALAAQMGSLAEEIAGQDEPRVHKWTRDEYYKMAEAGMFENKRVELIDGEVIEMSPMAQPHALCVMKVTNFLVRNVPENLSVRVQLPLTLEDNSEPEPDFAVVAGSPADYAQAHPSTAALVIEVSDSTLRFDRTIKASLYARAGIAEYWILNLPQNRLERFREPVTDSAQPHGFAYNLMEIVGPEREIAPLCAPEVILRVSEMLP